MTRQLCLCVVFSVGAGPCFLHDVLFHLHLHDNTGVLDHIEIGTGKVDWDDILKSLAAIGYRGSMVLEMNPDRVAPDRVRRSADCLRRRARDLGLTG